jgi:hypothetical protein
LADVKSLEALTRSYIHAQTMIGAPAAQVLKLPKDATDAAGWDAVYAKLGRPEKADGYAVDAKVLQAGGFTPEVLKPYQEAAHKAGLAPAQFSNLVATVAAENARVAGEAQAAAAAATQKAIGALKGEWGAAWDEKLHVAKVAMGTYGGEDFGKLLDVPLGDGIRLGDHPAVLKMFAALGATLSEDQIKTAGRATTGAMTPDEAMRKINANYSDPEFAKAYANAEHPKHAEKVEEMRVLFNYAHPAG